MEFQRHPDRTGLDIHDPIENVRFALFTPESVVPRSASTDLFYFPVDSAVRIETSAIEIPKRTSLTVRTRDGTMVTETTDGEDRRIAAGRYLIEVHIGPMKIYLFVESSLRIEHGQSAAVVRTPERCEVVVGARSYHDRPAETITVTDDACDLMHAVSLLGSSLKTTSPERSFPTLRGHPPLIERGKELSVPEGIERPETGVSLIVPPEREYVYPITSLAYYLGAEVVPGDDPRLVADGFERSLDRSDGYETTVSRTLRQAFFLDCITRTEGYYRITLHERERIEPSVELDFERLYDAPLPERLEAYFSVPFEAIEEHMPKWRLGVDLVPIPENVPYLPYLADDLALIRVPEGPTNHEPSPTPEAQAEFFRAPDGVLVRGSASGWESIESDEMFQVDPMPNVIEQAWAGPGYPLQVNKLDLGALGRYFDNVPSSDTIEVHVVCNDEDMTEEDVVSEYYGLRDLIAFDVTLHYDLTRDELTDLFARDADFLHYIGHIDETGFRCTDGSLDAHSLDESKMTAFLLNACRSYEQGQALIEKGSLGGVVTLAPVGNPLATDFGRIFAQLLNHGFPLRVALSIAQDHVIASNQYIVLGNGGIQVVQSSGLFPSAMSIKRHDDDTYKITESAYPTDLHNIGSIVNFNHENNGINYIATERVATYTLTGDELKEYINDASKPVEFEERLYWTGSLSSSTIVSD